jgi:hypothetical protein
VITHRTSRDIDFPETRECPAFTLPKGASVVLVKRADGIKGDLWAVRDAKIIMGLTGNTHDPKYRWTWVPDDAVEGQDSGTLEG